ncbi:translation elongation factor Ts [Mastigocoleus testarum]|uniref:Elongation factor Ts n=1 Tax=Mastigocoleus testarum BC008 TaxID=371196 RepID=A0A0V7ZP09_9CYAN|nr:translation elongation factor Ts [Mastigocoleus testarum]KST66146.1 elongation factor Ts [Mastigocoleus testarum BC008]
MVDISAQLVRELRQKTGVGMMDCKKALQATNGNVEKAIEWLRQKGIASAVNKSERITAEGLIESYIHTGAKVGVLLEVNCETDFVARSEAFQILVKDIAMQIAAYSNIEYINISDIPNDIINREKAIEMGRDDLANKPDNIKEKIVQGRIQKRLKEMSLMEQPYMREHNITVAQRVNQAISVLGENIKVRRFVRFVLGE